MSTSYIWPIDRTFQVLPLQVGVDLEAMAMKGYSAFPKSPELEPDYQIV